MFKSSAENKQFYKDLIAKANSVPLKSIFRFYKVKATENNPVVTCPFLTHSNGRERTPSFKYYHKTNTFHCFGCGQRNQPVNFVALMDNISIVQAAHKILEQYGSEATLDDNENDHTVDYPERLEILMDLSDFIREELQSNIHDNEYIEFVEAAAKAFDKITGKHTLDNTALKNVVLKMKDKVSNYKSCLPL